MIPNKYEAVKCKIQNELSKCKYCAITTDLWTSQHQNHSYISLTAHFITPEFHLRARYLQTKEILTDYSAQSIAEILQTFIAEWNNNFKVFGATTDNGSNVVNAVVDLQLIHMPCIGHTLQLSIKKAFDLSAEQRVIGRCKKCIARFNKSTKDMYKLHEKQKLLKLPEHELIQDCVTRWGSLCTC